jgi:hypothetical protein
MDFDNDFLRDAMDDLEARATQATARLRASVDALESSLRVLTVFDTTTELEST